MKSKIKNMLFGSITRELIFAYILSFILVVAGVLITVGILTQKVDTVHKMIADSNSLYVGVNKFVNRNDYNCSNYFKKLAKYYDLNAAITDLNGNIILKSENVYTSNVDLNSIRQRLDSSYRGGEFSQWYDVKLNGKDAILIVWKMPKFAGVNWNMNDDKTVIFYALSMVLLPVLIVIILIYFLTRKKVQYIKDICGGIKKISSGDLDYRIEKKGVDELSVLADEINSMSNNLKNKIEEERAAEKLKSELITNVSHDLRTPLTSLTAYLQLVGDDVTALEDKKKYTYIAIDKANKLGMLIEDLFEYSKLESGGVKLNEQEVNIIEVIEQSIGELSIQAKNKGISFDKCFSSNKVMLRVDPDKIGRVFENIISNAIKYGLADSNIYVGVLVNSDNVTISFKNSTNVQLEEHTGRIFDRFYRDDSSRNSEIGGSGLGLTIAKSIVELHEGCIWAESENENFKIFIRFTDTVKKNDK